MKKFKKLLFGAFMLTVLTPAFSANASDNTISANDYVTIDTIQPRSSVIVRVYRIYNGRPQYRRWNETKGCWVDPAWINLT